MESICFQASVRREAPFFDLSDKLNTSSLSTENMTVAEEAKLKELLYEMAQVQSYLTAP